MKFIKVILDENTLQCDVRRKITQMLRTVVPEHQFAWQSELSVAQHKDLICSFTSIHDYDNVIIQCIVIFRIKD